MFSFKHTPLKSMLSTFLLMVVFNLHVMAQTHSDSEADDIQTPVAITENPGSADSFEALLFQLHLKEQQELDDAMKELNFKISSTSNKIELLKNQYEELSAKALNYEFEAEAKSDAAKQLLFKECRVLSECFGSLNSGLHGGGGRSPEDNCKSKQCIDLFEQASALEARAKQIHLEGENLYLQITDMDSSLTETWALFEKYDEKYKLGDQAVKSAVNEVDRVLSEASIGQGELLIEPEYSMDADIIPIFRIYPINEDVVNETLRGNSNSLVSKIRLTNLMKVVLNAPTLSSHERGISSVQPISKVEPTQWSWQLTASDWGEHKLHVWVGAHLTVDGIETTRLIQEYEPQIVINAHYPTIILRFIKNNKEWVWTGVLIPFLALLYKIAKRVRAKAPPVKKKSYSDKLKGKKV